MSKGTSEKLAQEGLRGNRDRLAVGLRIPRARMVGRSPRDRRPVRMYDNSNRHVSPAFQNRGRGSRPSFFCRDSGDGGRKQRMKTILKGNVK